MELTTVWFALIAVLWLGYLVLEGFDFGVGMLLAVLARDDRERRVLLNTIGPVWDGNEVWLVVAVGATFAAFPEWYATLLSGFYLPLLLILGTLIVRAVGLEYRHKRSDAAWQRRWDGAIVAGSVVPAFLWGLVLANVVRGVPLDADHDYVGTLGGLLTPYALLGGATVVALCLTHGAFFVALKTVGDIRTRARGIALRCGGTTVTLLAGLLAWTALRDGAPAVWVAGAVAVAGLTGGLAAGARAAEGWAFTGTALAIGALVAAWFLALFPDVMPSSLDPAGTLTTTNAASSPYTLQILSWVALAFAPVVVGYQTWSYWVFRRRIGTHHIPA